MKAKATIAMPVFVQLPNSKLPSKLKPETEEGGKEFEAGTTVGADRR